MSLDFISKDYFVIKVNEKYTVKTLSCYLKKQDIIPVVNDTGSLLGYIDEKLINKENCNEEFFNLEHMREPDDSIIIDVHDDLLKIIDKIVNPRFDFILYINREENNKLLGLVDKKHFLTVLNSSIHNKQFLTGNARSLFWFVGCGFAVYRKDGQNIYSNAVAAEIINTNERVKTFIYKVLQKISEDAEGNRQNCQTYIFCPESGGSPNYIFLFNALNTTDIEVYILQSEDFFKFLKKLQSPYELAEEYNALLESSYDGIYVVDKNGMTKKVNSAWERITGIKKELVLNRSVLEMAKKEYYWPVTYKSVMQKRSPGK